MKKIMCITILLSSFLFAGCEFGEKLVNTPTKQVEIFLNKYQTLDKDVLDDLDKVISEEEKFNGEQREQYREIMKDSYQKLAYQIKDTKEDGDKATVTAEIEVVNYGKILSAAQVYLDDHPEEFQDAEGKYDESKFMDYRLKKMKEQKEKVKYTIDFSLTKEKEEWKLNELSETDEQKIQGVYQY